MARSLVAIALLLALLCALIDLIALIALIALIVAVIIDLSILLLLPPKRSLFSGLLLVPHHTGRLLVRRLYRPTALTGLCWRCRRTRGRLRRTI